MRWRVDMLGGFEASLGEMRLTRFESRRVVALLARLALYPRRTHAREELTELIWPEVDPEVGRGRLRHALASLRRQLEPPNAVLPVPVVLIADRHSVRLDPAAVTCDVHEFEDLVRRKRYAEALALYQGDLLPGLYDDWIQEERDRLTALYEEAQEGAADIRAHAVPQATPLPTPLTPEPTPVALAPRPASALLPSYLTAFFGRQEELGDLSALLTDRRLITLCGPGGSGKTRLSVELARQTGEQHQRVVFVPLADCVSAEQIPDRLRAAMHLPLLPPRSTDGDSASGQSAEQEALEQVVAELSHGGSVLLVLDNFEQLVETGGVALVAALLDRVPTLTCVVTSRRILGLPGEQEYPLRPLPVPDQGATLAEAAASPGVALFVDRARRARPDFQITDRNREDLVALCRELEGMPLALELAASRVRVYPIAQMRAQMADQRLTLLVRPGAGGHKDTRHASLRAAITWSWNLLSPARRRFLAALSVFEGGWTAEAATEVCEELRATEALEELLADSLVLAEESEDGEMRFRMLEAIREFAAERLREDSRERTALRLRHARYFRHLAATPSGHIPNTERPNLMAALRNATEDGDADTALGLCAALRLFWERRGLSEDAMAALHRALALPGSTEVSTHIMALLTGAYFTCVGGRVQEAREYVAQANALAEADADNLARHRASILWTEAHIELIYGGSERARRARALLEEATELARATGARRAETSALGLLGTIALRYENDKQRADRLYSEAQQGMESEGDTQRANYLLFNQANLAVEMGDMELAMDRYARCRRVCREIGDRWLEVDVLNSMGAMYVEQELWEEALAAFQECARRADTLSYRFIFAHALWNLPEPLSHLKVARTALLLMAFAERFWTEYYGELTEEDIVHRDEIRARATAALPGGEAAARIAWAEGKHLTVTEAIALAVAPWQR